MFLSCINSLRRVEKLEGKLSSTTSTFCKGYIGDVHRLWGSFKELSGLFLALFLSFTALSSQPSSAPAYDASGKLERHVYVDGEPYSASTNDFKLQVRGRCSRILVFNVPSTGFIQVSSYDFITDGTMSCFITKFDVSPEAVKNSQMLGNSKTNVLLFNSFVDVYPGDAPPNQSAAGPVWIALLSAATLQREDAGGGEMLPEMFICPDWPDIGGERIKASWSLSGSEPVLPTDLVEYADRGTFAVVNGFYKRWKQKEFPALYEAGYTNAIYQVQAWTNVGAFSFPERFQLQGFIPAYTGESPSQLQVQVEYKGSLNLIQLSGLNSITLPTRFSPWSQIHEYRYGETKGEPVVYTSKSGALLTKDETIAIKKGRNIPLLKRNAELRKHGIVIKLALALAVILPLGFLVYHQVRKSSS